ncbi:hypothetical protein N7931_07860 [Catenovulum sp. 2E275]|uniref:hypothetical protein n=1 Tax=Catenovulum sp. 2E275 TaxID=2980497 RepID=UPI0021D3552D|nr:hypothetical protein [Catenovulum sp. 2E275]MCU4675550.1 hypothetical protein [Catenovulum sp. 2E275]
MLVAKARTKLNKWLFNKTAQQIKNTKPIQVNIDSDVIVVSLVYSKGLNMALVAIKSFLRSFGSAKVELLDDGSLTEQDKHLIAQQLPGSDIIHIKDVNLGLCPSGGCWERLAYIIHRSQSAYVIQVDTDTITVGPVTDVYNSYKNNQSFTIGSPMWQNRASLQYLKHYFDTLNNDHVQCLGESKLSELNNFSLEGYLRGCAAFTGFAKGHFNFEMLEAFSQQMSDILGKQKWDQWGSEQFASNAIVSTDINAYVLPWPKYQNYKFPEFSENFQGHVSVIHYIGSCRFSDRSYEKLAAQVISQLK